MPSNRLIKRARNLRHNSTDVEQILWVHVRNNNLHPDLKFRRQYPLGKFIVDFVCLKAKVIIELDGSQHLTQLQDDWVRDTWLNTQGYLVLRFFNNEFLQQKEDVLGLITEKCLSRI